MKVFMFYTKETLGYLMGTGLIAFGVVMLFRSDLGVTPWDVLHVAISLVTPLTIGMAIIGISTLITTFIIITRRSLNYLFMVLPFVFVGLLVDFFNLVVFSGFDPSGVLRLVIFLTGLFTIPFGAALLIVNHFPAGIYDELMLVLMKLFQTTNLILVRLIMEATPVLIGVTLTGLFLGTAGELHIGTLVIVITTGPLMQLSLKIIRRIHHANQ